MGTGTQYYGGQGGRVGKLPLSPRSSWGGQILQRAELVKPPQTSAARVPAKWSNRPKDQRKGLHPEISFGSRELSPSPKPSALPCFTPHPAMAESLDGCRRPIGEAPTMAADSCSLSPTPPPRQPCSADEGAQSQPLKVMRLARLALSATPG